MKSTCRRCRAWLEQEAAGELDREEAWALEAHRQECAACRGAGEQWQRLREAMAITPPAPPAGLAERILLRLDAEGCGAGDARRSLPRSPGWLAALLVTTAVLLWSSLLGVGSALQHFWLSAARWQTQLLYAEFRVRDSVVFVILLEVAWVAGWLAWRQWQRYRPEPGRRVRA